MKNSFLKFHLFGAVLAALLGQAVHAAAPLEIAYQGKLTTNTGVPVNNGAHNVTFTVYSDPGGGSVLAGPVVKSVNVQNGVFSTVIDFSANPFLTDTSVYLDVAFNGSSFGTRQKLVAAPFALGVAADSVNDTDLVPAFRNSLARYSGNNLSLPNTGNLILSGGGKITGLGAPTVASDAATKSYVDGEVDASTASMVRVSGGNFSLNNVNLVMGGTGRITGLPASPAGATEAASKAYVDASTASIASMIPISGGNFLLNNVNLVMSGTGRITGLPASPVGITEAASKAYVDAEVDASTASMVRVSGGNFSLNNVNLVMGGTGRITGLPALPVGATEAASKQYVDGVAGAWNRVSGDVKLQTATDNVIIGDSQIGTNKLSVVGSAAVSGALTVGSGGDTVPITHVYSGVSTLNFNNVPNRDYESMTVSVDGAAVGDVVMIGAPVMPDGIMVSAAVTSANTVRVTVFNARSIDQTVNGDFRITVLKHQ